MSERRRKTVEGSVVILMQENLHAKWQGRAKNHMDALVRISVCTTLGFQLPSPGIVSLQRIQNRGGSSATYKHQDQQVQNASSLLLSLSRMSLRSRADDHRKDCSALKAGSRIRDQKAHSDQNLWIKDSYLCIRSNIQPDYRRLRPGHRRRGR